MLEQGAAVPHFEVTDADGTPVRYADVWQRRNLVLLTMPPEAPADAHAYAARVRARLNEVPLHDAALIVTRDPIAGIGAPGVLVADRWGEIHFAASSRDIAGLPEPEAIAEWVAFVRDQCPECQGEAR